MATAEAISGLNTAFKEPLNPKKPVRKWERRWVLQPNILDSGEIWIQKWICAENLNTVIIPPSTTTIELPHQTINAQLETAMAIKKSNLVTSDEFLLP